MEIKIKGYQHQNVHIDAEFLGQTQPAITCSKSMEYAQN